MRWILALYVICSIACVCFASGTEQKDEVTSLGSAAESEVLSSLLPDSQDSTYFLAFPVDEANANNDQREIVRAAGTEPAKTPTLEDDDDDDDDDNDGKDNIMTIMLDAAKNKMAKENVIPIQSLQPKQEVKFFSPPPPPPPPPFPLLPFPFKPKPERKITFPSLGRFRPKFLPPVRSLLQSFRREESPFKLNPMDIFGAASFLKKILSTKLRILTERYQPNIEEKIASMASPLFLLKESIAPSSSLFLPLPEPSLPGPLSHPFLLGSLLPPPPPPPVHPPMPFHPPFFVPPFVHPFFAPPTPFVPLPPYHPLPPFGPSPYYHHMPPPPVMYHHPLPPFPFPHPLPEPNSLMQDHPQEEHPSPKSSGDEFFFVPTNMGMPHFSKSEEPEYVFFYPNQPETINPAPPQPKSLLDLLRPKSNRVQHVIQQTRIITQLKPDMLNQPELLNYHKPIMRIMDN